MVVRRPLCAVSAAFLCVASLCLPLLLSQVTTVDGAVPPVNVTDLTFQLDGVNHTAKVPCDADGGSVAENLCSTLMANVPREPCLKVRGGESLPFSSSTRGTKHDDSPRTQLLSPEATFYCCGHGAGS